MRSAGGAAVASKLLRVLDALALGTGLEEASAVSSLDKSVAVRLLTSLRKDLETRSARVHLRGMGGSAASSLSKAVAFSDGASRGNPGEGACAAIILDDNGAELLERTKRLGVVTNNVAEYEGVILALELCAQLGAKDVRLKLDSELVVRQLQGRYKVKNAALTVLHDKARTLMKRFETVSIVHVARSETKKVDKLANSALDEKSQ
jgi:ribonuclease HI